MVEKEALFIGPDVTDEQVRLDRIPVEEMLRRLHDADARVVKKRYRPPQKLAMRDKIGIEDRDELRRIGLMAQEIDRVIDIARLGMKIVRTRQIMRALGCAQG